MKFTPEKISELASNEIFIFGSNENGEHLGGAARIAYEKFGAEWGQASGISGQSYGIPTLDRDMEKVEPELIYIHLVDLIEYVQTHPKNTFYLTKIGCGIAGWSTDEIKDIFWEAMGENPLPENLYIPKEFNK